MNSTVLAALIGVTGTAIVGVAGFGASIWNTRETLRAVQKDKLRERRSEVYLDVLATLNWTQLQRDIQMRRNSFSADRLKTAEAYVKAFKRPDPYKLEAQLSAFASAEVHAASQKSYQAAQKAWAYFETLGRVVPDPKTRKPEYENLQALRKAADDSDDSVVDLIRSEIHGGESLLRSIDMFSLNESQE